MLPLVPELPVLGVEGAVLGLVVELPLPVEPVPGVVCAWAATASDPTASAIARIRVNIAFSPFGCPSSPDCAKAID
jgi:hypothetical protein